MPSPGSRRRRWFPFALVLLATLGVGAESVEAVRASADVVLVREGEVVDEDLYAAGNVITIDGIIEGDLMVWAFDRLDVRGEVHGDVVGWAPTARITGRVDGSVRLVGLDISAAGEVGADVFAVGWSVNTGGSVGRDVLTWSRSLSIDGSVGRDVEGQTWGATTISGAIGRDVELTTGSMTLANGAFVAQDLGVRSDSEPVLAPEATVGGVVIRRSPVAPNVSVSAARFVAVVLGFMGFAWIGIMSIWTFPATMQRAVSAVRGHWRRAALVGIAALVSPLVMLAAILGIAAGAPPELALTILSVSTPFWLGLIALVVIGVIVAPVPVLIAVGRRLNPRWSAFAAFLVMAVPFVLVLLLVPVVRVVVVGAAVLVGLGSLTAAAVGGRGSLSWAAGDLPEAEESTQLITADATPDGPTLYAVDDDSGDDAPDG